MTTLTHEDSTTTAGTERRDRAAFNEVCAALGDGIRRYRAATARRRLGARVKFRFRPRHVDVHRLDLDALNEQAGEQREGVWQA